MAESALPVAIATIKAGSLLQVLSDDIVRKIIYDFLKRRINKTPEYVAESPGVMFRFAGCSLSFQRGELNVDMGPLRAREAEVCKREIGSLLERAAGLVFQQQVKNVIVGNFRVLQELRSSNGAIVLIIELWEGDMIINTKIAILPNGRLVFFLEEEDVEIGKPALNLVFHRLKGERLLAEFSAINRRFLAT